MRWRNEERSEGRGGLWGLEGRGGGGRDEEEKKIVGRGEDGRGGLGKMVREGKVKEI